MRLSALVLTRLHAHRAACSPQVEVNGPDASPVYNFLKASAKEHNDIEWNFAKFLCGCARNSTACTRFNASSACYRMAHPVCLLRYGSWAASGARGRTYCVMPRACVCMCSCAQAGRRGVEALPAASAAQRHRQGRGGAVIPQRAAHSSLVCAFSPSHARIIFFCSACAIVPALRVVSAPHLPSMFGISGLQCAAAAAAAAQRTVRPSPCPAHADHPKRPRQFRHLQSHQKFLRLSGSLRRSASRLRRARRREKAHTAHAGGRGAAERQPRCAQPRAPRSPAQARVGAVARRAAEPGRNERRRRAGAGLRRV
jgi:hypothetical protein